MTTIWKFISKSKTSTSQLVNKIKSAFAAMKLVSVTFMKLQQI